MKKVLFLVVYCFLPIAGFVQFDVDEELHQILDRQGLEPLKKLLQPAAEVELEHMLFFDRILGSKKDICCTTSHYPRLRSGDSLSLSINVGVKGLGKGRKIGEEREQVPQNAPKIFNRGAEAGIPCFGTAASLVH